MVGAPVAMFTVYAILFMVAFVGMMRFMAETGGGLGSERWYTIGYYNYEAMLYPLFIATMGGFAMGKVAFGAMFATAYYPGAMTITFMLSWIALAAWKLGKSALIRMKEMFIAVLVAFVLTPFSAIIGNFIWASYFPVRVDGPTIMGSGWAYSNIFNNLVKDNGLYETGQTYRGGFATTPENINMVYTILAVCIVVVFVLGFLRTRVRFFSWISLGTIPLVLTFGPWMWFPGLIALIAKYTLMKVYGIEAMEKGKAFGLGLLAAYFVVFFWHSYGFGGRFWWFFTRFGQPGWPGFPFVY
jgi:hypothetical protein